MFVVCCSVYGCVKQSMIPTIALTINMSAAFIRSGSGRALSLKRAWCNNDGGQLPKVTLVGSMIVLAANMSGAFAPRTPFCEDFAGYVYVLPNLRIKTWIYKR